jgi:hypothetical protein
VTDPGPRAADSAARLGRGGGRSGHWSCAHWLRAMAGIDAGEGAAAAAPPPEMTPEQRIQQVRRVSPSAPTSLVRDPQPPPLPRAAVVACRVLSPSGFSSRDWLEICLLFSGIVDWLELVRRVVWDFGGRWAVAPVAVR